MAFPTEPLTQSNELDYHQEEVGPANRFELLEADAPAVLPAIESPPLPTDESSTHKPKKSYSARKPRAKLYVSCPDIKLTGSERKNRRPITNGNNDAGKKGKRRCALCRKRHLKVLQVKH